MSSHKIEGALSHHQQSIVLDNSTDRAPKLRWGERPIELAILARWQGKWPTASVQPIKPTFTVVVAGAGSETVVAIE